MTRLRRSALTIGILAALTPGGIPIASAHHPAATEFASGPDHEFGEMVDYPLVFPVDGPHTLSDSFWAPRGGGSIHHGQDIMAAKMTPVLAAAAGEVLSVNWSSNPNNLNPDRCCTIVLGHDDGWRSWYLHLNDDSSPTACDGDGWGIVDGIVPGAKVTAGQHIGWVGNSGNASCQFPHLHFELIDPHGVIVNPYESLKNPVQQTVCAGPGIGCAALVDPGFESGSLAASPHLFVGSGGSWSIVDSTPRSGSHNAAYHSLNQTNTASIQANGPAGASASHLAVSAGNTVAFSAWVKSDAGRLNRFRPRAFFYDSSGRFLSAPVGATVTPTTSYRKIEVTAAAPTGTAYAVFRVQLFAEGYDGNYWVDDMHAEIVTDPGAGSGGTSGGSTIADPGFESGSLAASPHVFINSGGAWSIVDWTPRSGSHNARYKSVRQTNTASIQAGSHVAVSAGTTVTFSAWVKSDFGRLNRFRPRTFFYNSSGQLLSAPVGATVTPTTSYRKIEVTATAPAGTAYAVFRVQLFAEGYDGNYWVDDMHVEVAG